MDAYRIVGGKKLEGIIEIGGAKNAALPILCATLIEKGTYILRNVPALKDIKTLSKVLEKLGLEVENLILIFGTATATISRSCEKLIAVNFCISVAFLKSFFAPPPYQR